MKHIILLFSFLLLTNCTAQRKKGYATNTNPMKDTIMFKKFDFELHTLDYPDFERSGNRLKMKDGSLFRPFNGGYPDIFYYVVPSEPAYFSIKYSYYENGNLEKYGKYAGLNTYVKVGTWLHYDEIGRLQKVDEELKFEKWKFNQVLDVLDKDGVIDLNTGKNRADDKLQFLFDKEKKIWTITVFKKRKSILVDEYWEYLFDGQTGKYTREWYERYNENAADMEDLPRLENSKKNKHKRNTALYKTYEGKNYTQAEWIVFEQEFYNEYLRKTGRGHLVKPTETPKTENKKNSFLADENDVKPVKKKGFWG